MLIDGATAGGKDWAFWSFNWADGEYEQEIGSQDGEAWQFFKYNINQYNILHVSERVRSRMTSLLTNENVA